ncbi:fimbrial protein, partial [Xenorhabdus bovienii]|uniref:fimbrial protein n=1 Tax=Xenorhabdus bovienii TaxID=40576 RepID=UPI0034DE0FED|nr:fimbrial protein [Xenorhabdus bovienii]
GIQLRYGLTGNSFVEFGKKHKLNASMSNGLGIEIPLSARYIQTEDKVTPGTASGRVTYTMSYY